MDFDYSNAISVREGGSYFPKAQRGWLNRNDPTMLAIEDPFSKQNVMRKGEGYGTLRSYFAELSQGAFNS